MPRWVLIRTRAAFVPSLGNAVPVCLAAIAALKRRSSTSVHGACWQADPIARASSLFATSHTADDTVEERPFQGRVARIESEAAFRPGVPFRDSSQALVTSLTDNTSPISRPL